MNLYKITANNRVHYATGTDLTDAVEKVERSYDYNNTFFQLENIEVIATEETPYSTEIKRLYT